MLGAKYNVIAVNVDRDWTGGKELSPEGDEIVSGDHKMANGFHFSDYSELRRKIADAIIEVTK